MKILIVDDHSIVREGLKLILENTDCHFQVLLAENGKKALDILSREENVDLILLDIKMPVMDGETFMRQLNDSHSHIPVVVLTTFNEARTVQTMFQLGARSYLLKDADSQQILSTIDQVLDGDTVIPAEIAPLIFKKSRLNNMELSPRQQKVLHLLTDGYRNREIAEKMHLSERSIKNELTSIYNLFGVSSRSEAVAFAIKNKIV
ncbi:response regulator transcription factor [Eupransor demetentiae]|uniref:NarL/FixJ family n=1 Tax=Eupransor demetentiae TaxID=3109584 RepID=A0ABP0ES78_9LACO|nr:DNA-binding response regulator [Lactobacillaceae bacterium LMG 33000]